ncbi:ABC transporter permease [Actinomyces howellii]|uniref:Ribose transport system permease protein rbsC n=1 Tax=Actinomyces howellii TaxID=52771 RepID=A0A448HGC6_9ACTO|nr:ABC transporter permease [Actinomyces howellii]VEG27857.1 Ribose transport system permease protein rbsC [Actinomyces howellii]
MSALTTSSALRVASRLRGRNNEGVLLAILLVLVVGMSLVSPAFFTLSTLFAVLRSSIVPMLFALGVMMVIVSGGIDVSFAAIASFASYAVITYQLKADTDLGLLGSFAAAVAIGALLGAVNGLVISRFRLNTLIVTLGTQGVFMGVLLAYIGSRYVAALPEGMASASTTNIMSVATPTGSAQLHVMVIPVLVLIGVVAWLMNRTMFGRSIYAIGGDVEAARRAGIKVERTQMLVYVLVGVIAALAGTIYMIMGRSASPQELVGDELDIIAAVVLGGASIFGGRGSVRGTVIGVLLIQIINNSLILVGVPSAWQRTAVGVLLVAGVGLQAVSARRSARASAVLDEGGTSA